MTLALRRELTAVADVLSEQDNADRTADEVAEEVIRALDEVRAKTHRLAVVTTYRWRTDEEPVLAVLGPFSTRATGAASVVGSGMAGTPQGGSGKWMLAPAYASARAAWDAVRPPDKEARRLAAFLASIRRANPDNPSVWDPLLPPGSGATCCCGIRPGGYCRVHEKHNP